NIQSNPEFLTADGNFDYEKYQNYIFADENRSQLIFYARDLADGLPKEKFRLDVLNSYRVTTGEINEASEKENTGIKLTYLYFGPKVLQTRYTPTEAELKEYYNKNKEKYEQKERYRVKQVFFPLSITSRDSLDAQRQIEDAYALTKDEEFNIIIRDFSDTPNDSIAAWRKVKDLEPAIQTSIANLKTDSITPPILTLSGWQVIKADLRTRDSVLIRKIVKNIQITRETENALRDSVNNFVSRAQTVDFDTLAIEYGMFPREMPPMTKDRISFPAIYNSNQLKDFVLSAKPKAISEPLRGRAGYYLFQLIAAEPAKLQPLEQAKASIEWQIRREKEKELIKNYAETFLDKIKSRVPLEEVAGLDTLIELHNEEFASFRECRNRKGSEFTGTAYALNPGESYAILATDIGAFAIRCDEKKNNNTFNAAQYAEQRRNQVGNAIFQAATKQPEIVDYRNDNFF
ncbi:MAG: peptidyl-prolyl cis-trans isomerase, partial [Ignavibacteria bacterium]|nr:peptidyl-prolyl cis-trans isomerase [Ignavibacteria bacterium]